MTFTTGDWNIAQTVTLTGVDDVIDDGDIVYTIITAASTSTGFAPLELADAAGDVRHRA